MENRKSIALKRFYCSNKGKRLAKSHSVWLKKFYKTEKGKRLRKEISKRNRKYNVNEKFFERLNPVSAYVLGFWVADGHISHDLIRFDQKEKGILEKIKEAMGATYPLYRNGSAYRLQINSKKIQKSLNQLMSFPLSQKKNRAKYPDIPKELDSHFIRGVFDGDGCIYIAKNTQLGISFSSETKPFLKQIQQKLVDQFGINKTKIIRVESESGVCWELRYNGNKQVPPIFDWLYKGADLYLERKKAKYRGWNGLKQRQKVNTLYLLPFH